MGQSWYTIRTKPQSEYVATAELERQGFEVFLPCVKSPQPRIGRDDVPLFAGYLFLHCDLNSPEVPSFSVAPHVLGWLNFDGVIPPMPNDAITALTERLEVINSDGGLWRRFEAGETVEVVAGHFQGFAQVVEAAKSPEARVKVLIEFMGRTVPAQVPWESLRSVENAAGWGLPRSRRTRGGRRWIRGFGSRAQAVS